MKDDDGSVWLEDLLDEFREVELCNIIMRAFVPEERQHIGEKKVRKSNGRNKLFGNRLTPETNDR